MSSNFLLLNTDKTEVIVFLSYQVCKTGFFHLCNISKIRSILSQGDTEKLIHAFFSSGLDYCNALLAECPKNSLNSFQLIQNAAVQVLTGICKRDHTSAVLASLHWLPVKFLIKFKIMLLAYKALMAKLLVINNT